MPLELRITLIMISALVLVYVLYKIRASKINIVDSIFWIVFAVLLILLAVFPQISGFFSALVGIRTPLNFVLVFIIALLLLKVFLMSIQVSQQNEKIKELAQRIAFEEFERKREQKDGKGGR
jgi:hypothetical protein